MGPAGSTHGVPLVPFRCRNHVGRCKVCAPLFRHVLAIIAVARVRRWGTNLPCQHLCS